MYTSGCLHTGRFFESALTNGHLPDLELLDAAGDGHGEFVHDHPILRDLEVDDLALAHFAELFGRLDWILISPELEFVHYGNWPDRLSDHLAVEAVLRWRANR